MLSNDLWLEHKAYISLNIMIIQVQPYNIEKDCSIYLIYSTIKKNIKPQIHVLPIYMLIETAGANFYWLIYIQKDK